MSLLNLRQIRLAFGGDPLLDGVDLTLNPGERVCLIGRNGAGKSTLMKLVAGEIAPDEGERVARSNLKVARLEQQVPEGATGSVFEVVSSGLGEAGELIRAYHAALLRLESEADEKAMDHLSRVQHQLEAVGGWQLEQQVETVLSRLGLEAERNFAELSGGMKRRVLLARALVRAPDLLLLDEPTNHLDMESIDWLEQFLLDYPASLLFVTHDRMFLRRLATRIIELDRGVLSDWPGDYDNFLRRKDEQLNAEALANARFDKKLAQEEVWIRQGIKARRTRNEGRVRALEAMREERSRRREQGGKANLKMQQASASGRLVLECEGLSYQRAGVVVARDFATRIQRGDKVGVIGPNGCGKTTLLKLLLGELKPDAGQLRLGSNLEIAFFDQLRETIDPDLRVRDAVADGADKVQLAGGSRHVIGYLQDFLFSPDRANQPVSSLSGGERGRLLLARLFARPFNLLIMDEPTNDLDTETLELLEERLLEFEGTLLLVSHDRAFLNHVVTSTLVFEGQGRIGEYVGGYDDWLRQRRQPASAGSASEATASPAERAQPKPQAQARAPAAESAPRKLSYKDQRELNALPERIAELEGKIERRHAAMLEPAFFQQPGDAIAQARAELEQLESQLEQAFARWERLEAATAGGA